MSTDERGPAEPSTSKMVVETHIPGDPEAFHALATYLRGQLGAGVETLSAEVATHRSILSTTWRGEAGAAFGTKSARVVTACDNVSTDMRTAADQVDTLGDTLRVAQDGLDQLRAAAPARGLTVHGTQIWPGEVFLRTDAPFDEMLPDITDSMAQLAAWNETADAANGYWKQWYDAVNETGGFLVDHAGDLVGFLSDLVTTAATKGLLATASNVMTKQSQWFHEQSERFKGQAAALEAYIARTGDPSAMVEHSMLVDESIKTRYAAEAAAGAATESHLPAGVRGGLGSLTALATGVGIYADMHEGESGTQAVVSQTAAAGVGTLGAIGAGFAAGTLLAPGPGSIGGAIAVGSAELIVGTAFAIGMDQAVDWAWPDGDQPDVPTPAEQYGGTLLDYAGQVTSPEHPAGEAPP